MKAVILQSPGEAVLGSAAEPRPEREELLLKVRMVGLCGSDLNSFRGKKSDGEFSANSWP